jgi:hypothetical protein
MGHLCDKVKELGVNLRIRQIAFELNSTFLFAFQSPFGYFSSKLSTVYLRAFLNEGLLPDFNRPCSMNTIEQLSL